MPEDESILSRPAPPPDQIVPYGDHADQVADVRRGDGSRPLVVLIHGGFWRPTIDRAHAGPMAVALAQAGWTVAAVEYRRVQGNPDLTVEDISLSLEVLPAKLRQHDGRVIAMGHSAGGHLALWAASKRPVPEMCGALSLAPVADLQLARDLNLGQGAVQAFLGGDPKTRADLDPKRMPAPAVPVTIVQGDDDETVPPSVARSYVASHPRTRLLELPHTGHYPVIDPQSEVWPAVLRKLELLGAPRGA